MSEDERYESLRHCKWVDVVVKDAPWVLTKEFLDSHKIDFVCHDALPYVDTSGGGGDVYQKIREWGMFHETQRTEVGFTTQQPMLTMFIAIYILLILRYISHDSMPSQECISSV